ncbi:MAG TPA: ferritin-like fold-containing protein [Dermatophilaceae bacterium]|nr:ferritin-like fold-containing protein [Dermatophilaceae bacterium]
MSDADAASVPPSAAELPAVVDLLGALGYATLSGFGAMAEDAALAPGLADKSAVAGMAVALYHHHEQVANRLRDLGADPSVAMAPFAPAIDGFHDRTRPSDWLEGLVKAYVGDGIARDFYAEVARFVDEHTRVFVLDVLKVDGRGDYVVDTVRAACADDPRVAGRLALWGRRIMGEAMQQAQLAVAERDTLSELLVGSADLAEVGRMFDRIGEAHTARMVRLGLSA